MTKGIQTMSATDETRRILELLRDRHNAKDEWATFAELRAATAFTNMQRLDFFAIHLWPSKNYRSIAYENKVSRSDFKKEIDNPQKRAFAESVANECFFVMPRGLIQPDEIPEGWGLLEADASGLKVKKHAAQRSNIKWPEGFVASLARRASDPPPALPAAVWKVHGREVGETELLTIAEQTLRTKLEMEYKRIFREGEDKGRADFAKDREYIRYSEVFKVIMEVSGLGFYQATPEAVHAWAMARGGLKATDIAGLRNAHHLLGRLLEETP